MATINWIASTSQGLLWTDPSNWVGGVVPGASDAAAFASGSSDAATIEPGTSVQIGNVVVSSGVYAELDILGTLDVSGTLSLAGSGTQGSGTIDGGTLDVSAGGAFETTLDGVSVIGAAPSAYQFYGTIINGLTVLSPYLPDANLTFSGNQTLRAAEIGTLDATLAGTLTVAPGTTIDDGSFSASQIDNGGVFSSAGTLVNDGTITTTITPSGFGVPLINAGLLTIAESNGVITTPFDNLGVITTSGAGELVSIELPENTAGGLLNAGLLHVAAGDTLDLADGALTNTSGVISIDAGGIFEAGGTVTGGTIASAGGTLSVAYGTAIDGVTLEGNFADLAGSADGTTGFGSQTPGVRASATIASGFAFVASATVDDVNLSLADTSYSNNLELSSTADLTLESASNIAFFFGPENSSYGYTYDRASVGAGGSLILGGTIDAFAGQVYLGGGTGGIVNTGTILTAAGETLTFGPADTSNDSATTFANDGLFQIAAGSDIVVNAYVTAAGFSGLTQNGATLTLGYSGTIDGSATPGGGTITLPAGSIVVDEGLLRNVTVLDETAMTVGGTLDSVTWVGMPLDVSNQAMTVVRNGLTVTGTAGAPGSIVVGGTNTILNLQTDTTLDNVNITVGSTLADPNGNTISLIDGANQTGTGVSNLTIGSNATLTIGGTDAFEGLQNLGTLTVLGTLQIGDSAIQPELFPTDEYDTSYPPPPPPPPGDDDDEPPFNEPPGIIGAHSIDLKGNVMAGPGGYPAVGEIANTSTADSSVQSDLGQLPAALSMVVDQQPTGEASGSDNATGQSTLASASSPPSGITPTYLRSIESSCSGSGTIESGFGRLMFIDASTTSTLNLDFASSTGFFAITDPANTSGLFENFGAGDGIDLSFLGYAGGTVTYSNGQLVIPTASGSFALNVAFASGYSAADVAMADDTEGGAFAYIPFTASATIPASASFPDVSASFTPPVLTTLQSVLTALTAVGATPNVASVTGAGSAGSPVAGTLNAAVYSSVASGATIDLPTSFMVGYLLSGAATLQDTTGGAALIATAAGGSLIGASNDTLFGGNSGETLFATTGAETLIGGAGTNAFFLGASNALLTSQGNDLITGSSGAETVNASGSALYFGTSGATTFNASGTGGDTIIGGNDGNTVQGGGGGQLIFGSTTLNYTGGSGAATIIGGGNGNTITGGSGNELIFASSSLTYNGTGGAATIIGGGGPMNVNLGSGGGVVYGSPNGSDTLASGSGTAILVGGGPGDVLVASGSANDTMVAGGGAETLSGAGSTGNLVLFGGPGNDTLVGGTGGNLFIAESGNETLVGGGSSDSTIFIATPGTTRTDVIVGFNPSVDAIGLFGYGAEPGADQAALASATTSGGNTVVSLTDGTTIIFTGAPTLNSYNFF